MPWCPKCKNEYVEGVKVCADCGVELVDSLETAQRAPIIFGEQEQMERLKDFLLYNRILSAEVSYDEKEDVYELSVKEQDRQKAKMSTAVFLREEEAAAAKEVLAEDKSNIEGYPMPVSSRNTYQNSGEKAKENRSSAWMLLVIGGAGMAAVLLIFSGILKIPVTGLNRYMICGVMGALFLLFFIMGILSMKSSRTLEKKAQSENSLTVEIQKWCRENLDAQRIDGEIFSPDEDDREEIRYFRRTEKMKQLIAGQFLHLDENFLDFFVDDYYPGLFEQDAHMGQEEQDA